MFPEDNDNERMVKIENIVDLEHLPDMESMGGSPKEEGETSEMSGDSFHGDDDGDINPHSPCLPVTAPDADAPVKRSKMVIYGLMTAFSGGICLLVYFYLKSQEKNEFEHTFTSQSFSIFDSVSIQLGNNLAIADTFALALTSYARSSESRWPFVTLPDSALSMSKVRAHTKSSLFTILNLVSDETRSSYEQYVLQNYNWANETVSLQATDESLNSFDFKLADEVSVLNEISDLSGEATPVNTGPYTASWQTYPLLEESVSFNVDFIRNRGLGLSLKMAVDSKRAHMATADVTGNHEAEPEVSLIYPVLDKNQTTAILLLVFPWSLFFRDVLRDGERGLMVVITNKCTTPSTYLINGPTAEFIGFGDHHSQKYDDNEMIAHLPDLFAKESYGVPLDTDVCPYTLKAYPTKALEDDEKSLVPLLIAMVTLGIFVLFMLSFRWYDAIVNHRQNKLKQAGRCHKTVRNLVWSYLFMSHSQFAVYRYSGG